MERNLDVSISVQTPSASVEQTTSAASIPSDHISTPSQPVEQATISEQPPVEESEEEEKHWIEKKRTVIVMVAVFMVGLAITTTYNPPRGNWKHDNGTQRAGHPILADDNPAAYQAFIVANATSCLCSLNIITMMMCGLRFNQKIRIWFFLGLSWVSIMGIVCAYVVYLCV